MLRSFLETFAFLLIVTALTEGITVNGKHYGIRFSCEKGVVVQ